jgi:hypothetical protein
VRVFGLGAPPNQGAGERSFPLGDSLIRGCRDEGVPRGRDHGGGPEGNGWRCSLLIHVRSSAEKYKKSCSLVFNALTFVNGETRKTSIFAAYLSCSLRVNDCERGVYEREPSKGWCVLC